MNNLMSRPDRIFEAQMANVDLAADCGTVKERFCAVQ